MAVYRHTAENAMVPGSRTTWVDAYADDTKPYADLQYGITQTSDGGYYGWSRQGQYGETFYTDFHTESHEDMPITVFGIDY
jgi:hypothetical protein